MSDVYKNKKKEMYGRMKKKLSNFSGNSLYTKIFEKK